MADMEAPGGDVRYGTKGPDKFAFLMEGVLDRSYDGRDHQFTIDGKEMDISITSARKMPAWQCPPYEGLYRETSLHERYWQEAWEFTGVTRGFEVLAVYSPVTRRGVFHFWPIALAGHKDCEASRRDLHLFFAGPSNSGSLLALHRAMEHMVRGSALGGYHVDCKSCWELFRQLRQTCELP